MAQVKIYGQRAHVHAAREAISDAIHSCAVEALGLPEAKRFHRFLPLDEADFIYPGDRSDRYTIIEISMFEGRAVEVRKRLIRSLFSRLNEQCGLAPNDVEITITETPRCNWGIRGLPADELELNYTVTVD